MLQLEEVTEVKFTNVTAVPQLHGDEKVRAVYIRHRMSGSNRLLDMIKPGLRAQHYFNAALEAGQQELPAIDPELPDLRMPEADDETTHKWKVKKARGFRWILDFGLGDEISNIDLTDCVVDKIEYTTKQGGSVEIEFTVAYNGDDLGDDTLHGRIVGLATDGEGFVKLIAPATLVEPKKGWRSGKPDATPAAAGDGQGELGDGEEDQDEEVDPDSPEGRLAGAVGQPVAVH